MPTQRLISDMTIVEATLRRIHFAFDHFDHVICSISGGKDSTVMAELVTRVAEERGRKAGLFFLDEEVVYQSTIDQIEYLYARRPHATNRLWLQIPFRLTNATSYEEGQLDAWDPAARKVWMRKHDAKRNITAKPWAEAQERFTPGYKWLDFYGVISNFERTYEGAAFLVGERAQEAPNRWRFQRRITS